MTEISTDVFAHGLAAGLSASAFLAAIVVLSTEWGVADALALLASFVVILATVVVGAPMLSDISTAAEDHQVVTSLFASVLGLMFLRQVALGFVPPTLAATRASAKLIPLLWAQNQD